MYSASCVLCLTACTENRKKELKSLSDHLQMVVSNKEYLVTRLQQPFVGDYIKLEAAFHKYTSQMFICVVFLHTRSHMSKVYQVYPL